MFHNCRCPAWWHCACMIASGFMDSALRLDWQATRKAFLVCVHESSSAASLICHKSFLGRTELSKQVSFLRLMPQNGSDLEIQFLNFFLIITLQKQKWQGIPLTVCTFIHILVLCWLAGIICGTFPYFLIEVVIYFFSTVAFRFQV